MIRSVVQGCGAYLPDRIVTNDELAKKVDTSDEWIQQRTGIKQRHIAADGEFTSHLAIKASERALAHAGLKASDLDLIILATATPDETFPATATRVQAALGMTKGAAFDVQAVCAGFVYAVSVADSMIKSGAASTALVIGAETFSRILDWNDRGTCVLFGDGAGAIVMRGEEGKGTAADRGVLANASALRRPPARHPLCRRRPVLDQDHGLPAHGRQGSVQAGGGQHGGRGRRSAATRWAWRPRTSTGWSRTRPTSASSTAPAASSA